MGNSVDIASVSKLDRSVGLGYGGIIAGASVGRLDRSPLTGKPWGYGRF